MTETTRTHTEQQKKNAGERPSLGVGYDAALSGRAGLSSPQADILTLQRAAGNGAVTRLLQPGTGSVARIQTKLAVNQPGDRYEQEADLVAREVTRISGPRDWQKAPVVGRTSTIQRLRSNGAVPGQTVEVTPDIETRINALHGGSHLLPASLRTAMEARFGQDFYQVRLHTTAQASKIAQGLKAQAFTIGKDIVFGPGQFAPETPAGMHLLAHELVHVVQQSNHQHHGFLQRSDDPRAETQTSEGSRPETAAKAQVREPHSLARLEREEPETARLADRIDMQARTILTHTDEQMRAAGIQASRAQMRIIADFTSYQERMVARNLLDARHLSLWALKLERVLRILRPLLVLLRTRGDVAASHAEQLDQSRQELLNQVSNLKRTPFIRRGMRELDRERARAREQERIDEAVENVRNYVRDHWRENLSDQVKRLHGLVVAGILVRRMRLNAEQIREVFDTLRDQDPRLLDAALFAGGTVQTLLEMGISGLQAYRASGEGFISGVIRGERESLLAREPGQREFTFGEIWIAAGGFVAGALQGIGDSIISNVKAIIEVFTLTFWQGIVQFFREFLPQYIEDEEFRFEVGQMLGQASAREIRRLATASPFEYGRTIGHVFGSALTEIVLSFIGLGFVLKAVRSTSLLGRISPRLLELARRVSRTAVVARGISIAQSIAEGIGALAHRVRQLRNRLPALTSTGRMRRAVDELSDAEQAIQQATARVDDLERNARRALAEGDEQLAQRHLQEMNEVVDDLERHIAVYEREVRQAPQQGRTGAAAQERVAQRPRRQVYTEGELRPITSEPEVFHRPRSTTGTRRGARPGRAPERRTAPARPRRGTTREEIAEVMGAEIERPGAVPEDPRAVAGPVLTERQFRQRFRSRLDDIERHHSFFSYLLRAIAKARGVRGVPRHGRRIRIPEAQHQAMHRMFDELHPGLARRLGASDEIAEAIRRGEITPREIADHLVEFYRDVSRQSPDLLPPGTLDQIERVIASIRRRANI
jgi:hypothetical protein